MLCKPTIFAKYYLNVQISALNWPDDLSVNNNKYEAGFSFKFAVTNHHFVEPLVVSVLDLHVMILRVTSENSNIRTITRMIILYSRPNNRVL